MLKKIKQQICKHEWKSDSLVWVFPKTHIEPFYKCKKCGKLIFTEKVSM